MTDDDMDYLALRLKREGLTWWILSCVFCALGVLAGLAGRLDGLAFCAFCMLGIISNGLANVTRTVGRALEREEE